MSCLGLAALMGCGSDNNNNNNQATTYTVPLSPASETPPCTAAGTGATGTATVTIAADNSSVKVDATYSGLSGPATLGHIHSGDSTKAGPVVLPFKAPLTSPFSQTLTAADYVAATGAPPDFAAFVTALKAGNGGYVNFHTAACGPGEIRGEINSQPKTFTVALSPANETPPCTSAGASATGTATVTIAADNSSVKVDATYSGLSGPATLGHIHSGDSTKAGPVVLPFKAPLTSPFSQTLTAADYVAATGAPPDFAAFVTALKAGGAGYVNFHTAACGPGEIRGEIQ
ncbi:MAG TPA: CHRD domain-containing protein [Anaeromyxobacteraceae bacterium]|nr:CHRD domain-containing protein [Anaeromyxobacteraceae bacterium]